ncbi:MAG: allophanate hydrolase [Acidimicrobiaceae bacterium]|nr:allophanate hydrolase [Acidimicrobiaceae bacterium]
MPSAVEAVERAYARIEADGSPGIFIELIDRNVALGAARGVDAVSPPLPLAGTTLAVKGNIDVAGHRTTAGCPTFGSIAGASAPVVRALEAAGTVVVAITNLDQFATGLVGTRSPHGICPNAHWPGLISGGSSSGSAVAVARELVDLALGTDTAGSGRVPAAANGIVGLKPTRGWLSTAGVVPACRSLDCVSVLAREVELGWTALQLAAGHDPDDPFSRIASRPDADDSAEVRVGIGCGLPPPLANAVEVDLEPFLAAGRLLYDGAFVAERYAAVGSFVDAHRDEVDATVGAIIAGAGRIPAWQLARDHEELARWRQATEATWKRVDVLVLPTVPRVPTVAEVIADPVGVNAELGTYTNFVNLLDLCALTVPLGRGDDHAPPPSVTLIAPAWRDGALVSLSRRLTRDRSASLRSE